MAKKISKSKSLICGIFCLILGLLIGFFGDILFTLPSSYKIPDSVLLNSNVTAKQINATEIKSNELSIHFLELGNKYTGDCILIKFGDTEILVDGGSKASSIPTIKNYVDKFIDDGNLEFIIVTHAHEDHYAGFATSETTESLFDYYRPKANSEQTIIDFGNQTNKSNNTVESNYNAMFSNYLRERNESIVAGAKYFSALDCYENKGEAQRRFYLNDENSAYIQILYQKFYREHATTENNYSVCFKVVYDSKTYLFTGDLEKAGEESLVSTSENELGEVELYKAGHHGSKTSSSEALMSRIKPKYIVVCCVAGSSEYTSKNENQFPTQEFINNVFKNSSPLIFVTSLCINYSEGKFESFNGTVVICENKGKQSNIICSNNSLPLHETEWFKANRTLPEKAAA